MIRQKIEKSKTTYWPLKSDNFHTDELSNWLEFVSVKIKHFFYILTASFK